MAKKQGLINPVKEIIVLCMTLVIVSFMALLVVQDKARNVGNYIVFIYLLRCSSTAVTAINDIRTVMARMSGSIREIRDVFSDKEKHIVPEGDLIFSGLQEGIDIERLTFQYDPQRSILTDIQLKIPKGRMTAIVGPGGAGKTTLVHLLLCFFDCPAGTIRIDEHDIRSYRNASLMKHVAFVGQEACLFNMS